MVVATTISLAHEDQVGRIRLGDTRPTPRCTPCIRRGEEAGTPIPTHTTCGDEVLGAQEARDVGEEVESEVEGVRGRGWSWGRACWGAAEPGLVPVTVVVSGWVDTSCRRGSGLGPYDAADMPADAVGGYEGDASSEGRGVRSDGKSRRTRHTLYRRSRCDAETVHPPNEAGERTSTHRTIKS